MEPRLNFYKSGPEAMKAMTTLEQQIARSGLDKSLVELVRLRASQINGCAYCIDMHWKDLVAIGEKEQRLYSLDAWRESPYYSERERAALHWTEAVTSIEKEHVPDSVYEAVRSHFNEKELADLTLAVATINSWNRLSIAARLTPGTYQPTPSNNKSTNA